MRSPAAARSTNSLKRALASARLICDMTAFTKMTTYLVILGAMA
jgi:hypothetical protein